MLAFGEDNQKQVQSVVGESINDFYKIGMGDKSFTTEDCINLGKQHHEWLEYELSKNTDMETFVITHFSPTLDLGNPRFPVSEISAYFCNIYDELIDKYKPEIWAFGHTHANFDIKESATRVVSNQQGYGQECTGSYQPNFYFTI